MNLRQLAYGVLSFLPGPPDRWSRGTGGTGSALYCYAVWLRHLAFARTGGLRTLPRVVAELGPGDSIGVGLAALVSGVERYLAFDVVEHALHARNLELFDEIVALFERRQPIPGAAADFDMPNAPDDMGFPSGLLDDAHLQAALAPARIAALRERIARGALAPSLEYQVRWMEAANVTSATVDLVLSQAVMEHVADIDAVYRATARWLRPEGLASHQIDFRSHGLFRRWDGHWACPDWLWRLFVGRRPYLINRLPLSAHVVALERAGFEPCIEKLQFAEPAATRLAPRFQGLSDKDRRVAGAYLLSRRRIQGQA